MPQKRMTKETEKSKGKQDDFLLSLTGRKFTGKVLDIHDKNRVVGKQVLIFAKEKDSKGVTALIASCKTDKDGYFSHPYVSKKFENAFATVPSVSEEKVRIALVNDMLPLNILVGLDISGYVDDADCVLETPRVPDNEDLVNSPGTYSEDVGDGEYLKFNTPNRTLEEYSFYSVVRTTDPKILQDNVETYTRKKITAANPVSWQRKDQIERLHQATTIAHGHILQFKQIWKADGYSLGDLLYSLPLAPGQKKKIAIVDWDRNESTQLSEELLASDNITAGFNRDRDVSEIVNSSLQERMKAGSWSKNKSGGGGFGFAAKGFVLGASGGASKSSSKAWQNSSRNVAADSLQKLRDNTMQSASSLRSQRATVLHTVGQNESVASQTEVVANYNHGHALTMQYFEVLRHFQVSQELVGVQECLFIPLRMITFDTADILAWKEELKAGLLDQSLVKGFDALKRSSMSAEEAGIPDGCIAEQHIEYLEGALELSFDLRRPKDKKDEKDKPSFFEDGWSRFNGLIFGGARKVYNKYLKGLPEEEKDRAFQKNIAPQIAENFVKNLVFKALGEWNLFSSSGSPLYTAHSGVSSPNDTPTPVLGDAVAIEITDENLNLDSTLLSSYRLGANLKVRLRLGGDIPEIKRRAIERIIISDKYELPEHSKVIIKSLKLNYRTQFHTLPLVRNFNINDDISVGNQVIIDTPLTKFEQRNFRNEDQIAGRTLKDHILNNMEYYHKVMWSQMDADKRFMLLDQFSIDIPDLHETRSLSSVIENKLIGIVGNSLVMPVARGFRLDPTGYGSKLRYKISELEVIHTTAGSRNSGSTSGFVLILAQEGVKTEEFSFPQDAMDEWHKGTQRRFIFDLDSYNFDYRYVKISIRNLDSDGWLPRSIRMNVVTQTWQHLSIVDIRDWPEDKWFETADIPEHEIEKLSLADIAESSEDEEDTDIDLIELYAPEVREADKMRISVPTKGVFGEAVLGSCNSNEIIDDTRFWRWEESPIPGDTPDILPTSTDSRRADPVDTTPTGFSSPIINMQSVPTAPDPSGLGAAMNVLGSQGVFKDITGLEGNQQNSLAAFQSTMEAAKHFGSEASKLAQQKAMSKDISKTMKEIETAKKKGLITEGQASNLAGSALGALAGTGAVPEAEKPSPVVDKGLVKDLVPTMGNNSSMKVSSVNGEVVELKNEKPSPMPDGGLGDAGSGNTTTNIAHQTSNEETENPIETFKQFVTRFFEDIKLPPKQKAKKIIKLFKEKNNISCKWTGVDKLEVAKRLEELVDNADKINQGSLGLCMIAAFFNVWIKANPVFFVIYVIDLYETGSGSIGTINVKAKDILKTDYRTIDWMKNGREPMTPVEEEWHKTPVAEWIAMGALEDFERINGYGGTPYDGGGRTMSEIEAYLKATGDFKQITVYDDDLEELLKVSPCQGAPGECQDILIDVYFDMLYTKLDEYANTSDIEKAFNDIIKVVSSKHMIILEQALQRLPSNAVRMLYWNYGRQRRVDLFLKQLSEGLRGFIIVQY